MDTSPDQHILVTQAATLDQLLSTGVRRPVVPGFLEHGPVTPFKGRTPPDNTNKEVVPAP